MALTEEEARLIREDRRAGMGYKDLAFKHRKSFRDIKIALDQDPSLASKGRHIVESGLLPTVTLQVRPNQLTVEVKWR